MKLEDCLRRLHYHWFWGLREVKENYGSSLWVQVETWKTSPELVVRIREKQREISRKIGMIRLFYWLFNITNYAEDDYKLNGYDAVLLEDKGMYQKSKETVGNVYGGMVAFFKREIIPGLSKFRGPLPSWRSNDAGYSKTEASRERSVGRTAEVSSVQEKTLRVNCTMLPHLQSLGLTCTVGETIKFIDIKKAYFREALATHPDKNPSVDTTLAFKSVLQAYEVLKAMFEGRAPIANTNLWRTMDELSKDFQELTKDFRGLTEDFRRIGESYNTIAEDYRRLRKSYDAIAEESRGIQRQCRWILEEQDRQARKLDELEQEFADSASDTTDGEAPVADPAVPPASAAPFTHNYGSIHEERTEESNSAASLRH